MKVDNPRAFHAMDISGSGLHAQRRRMDAIAENLANLHTTRTADGGPFKPRVATVSESLMEWEEFDPLMERGTKLERTHEKHFGGGQGSNDAMDLSGVNVEIHKTNRPPRLEYDPGHPDANEEGYVAYPDINVVEEMTHLMAATRAYEANLTAINAAKEMAAKALEI
jgi:flagellar basal-body rod protein FlgC